MHEFRLFIGFFAQALKTAWRQPAALFFGLILTVGSVDFYVSLIETGAPLEQYQPLIAGFLKENLLLLALSVPITLAVATFSKSGLILALSEKSSSGMISAKKSIALLPKLLSLEILFLVSVLLVLVALLLPAMLTADTPSLGLNLALLGFVIFLPILIIFTFVEIYAFFYILLSKTSLRSGIELGYALFMKRLATSVLFGVTSILVMMAVSLIVGTILGISDLLISDPSTRSVFGILLLLFMYIGIVIAQKGAWLSFFRFIGTERPTEETSQKREGVLQREVPEVV